LDFEKILSFISSHYVIYAPKILLSDLFLFMAISKSPNWKIPTSETPVRINAECYSPPRTVFLRGWIFVFAFLFFLLMSDEL